MSATEELCDVLDDKIWRWNGLDVGHNRVFSLTDYDYSDRHLLRSFCTTPVIPWSAFDELRRESMLIGEEHAKNIAEDLAKLTSSNGDSSIGDGDNNNNDNSNTNNCTSMYLAIGQSRIAEPVKSIGKLFEELFPMLCATKCGSLHRGATFLMLAVITGNVELARRCIELGANPNNMSFLSDQDVAINQMQHGYSPMFISIITGKIEMMSLLHHYGGSLYVYDRWGRSPLQAAVAIGNTEVIEWLLSKGAPRCIGSCVPIFQDTAKFPALAQPHPTLMRRPGSRDGGKQKDGDDEHLVSCHCRSGRPKGYCGCVDDMFLRWSFDRLQTRWLPGLDLSTLAAAHVTNGKKKMIV